MPVTPWNYSGNPAASTLDGVRFLCEDTNPLDPQLNDNEVNYFINMYQNMWRAAGNCAKVIKGKYARQADKSVGDLRVAYSQRQAAYEALSDYCFMQATAFSAVPWAGGISWADKMLDVNNPDVVKPDFTKHQFQFPVGDINQDAQGGFADGSGGGFGD